MEEKELEFQGFNSRWKSHIVDSILCGLFFGLLNFINITSFKSFSIYLIASLIILAYKPVMETFYGATLGKMLVHIKVVDYDGNPINSAQAWLRSIFNVFQFLLVVVFHYAAFKDPVLQQTKGYLDYLELFNEAYPGVRYITDAMFIVVIAEIFSMNLDPQHRSIHDRIAKTYVIKNNEDFL